LKETSAGSHEKNVKLSFIRLNNYFEEARKIEGRRGLEVRAALEEIGYDRSETK
jgi:hypothetical protein